MSTEKEHSNNLIVKVEFTEMTKALLFNSSDSVSEALICHAVAAFQEWIMFNVCYRVSNAATSTNM